MKGNAKDVCKAQAKGDKDVAEANAEANYKGTEKAWWKARKAKADADYSVAKEKCDDLKGNDKDICQKDAKAAHVKAVADAKVAHETSEAKSDAREDINDANYKAAKERCDGMTGAGKDKCVDEVKAKYGK